ncbi:hypothetical protein MAR_027732, partial [Mya arenaria]
AETLQKATSSQVKRASKAKQCLKRQSLLGAWSFDGSVLIKDTLGNVHVISSYDELSARLSTRSYAEVAQASATDSSTK